MNDFFLIYLVNLVFKLHEVLLVLLVVFGVLFVAWIIVSEEKTAMEILRKAKPYSGYLIAIVAFLIIVPSKQDALYIIGGGVALQGIQNEEVQELPENLVKAMNVFLEEIGETRLEQ